MVTETVERAAPQRDHQQAIIRLDQAAGGELLRILAVEEHSDENGCRLREMGLYEGARVDIITAGDPVVLCLMGARIAVCRRCARHVTVERVD